MSHYPAGKPPIPTGPHGSAIRIAIPATPAAAQTADYWVVTSPGWTPWWSQWLIAAVRLQDDVPGFPPPKRHFDGATHEQMVVALDPQHGPYDAAKIAAYSENPPVPIVLPVSQVNQFIATDDEIQDLCWFAAWAVINGALNPEGSRVDWLTSMTKTLAHVRGEVHAR